MLDDLTAGATARAPHCTWCSAELPSDHETVCPSCGATLLGDGEKQVPGLTAIDAEAILRNARAAKAKPRSRILSWISGDYEAEDAASRAAPGSLAPPAAAVRREMLRLELEAQVANAQAEVESMAADAAIEGDAAVGVADASEATDVAATDAGTEQLSAVAEGPRAEDVGSDTDDSQSN
jgi:hypothetical protein